MSLATARRRPRLTHTCRLPGGRSSLLQGVSAMRPETLPCSPLRVDQSPWSGMEARLRPALEGRAQSKGPWKGAGGGLAVQRESRVSPCGECQHRPCAAPGSAHAPPSGRLAAPPSGRGPDNHRRPRAGLRPVA